MLNVDFEWFDPQPDFDFHGLKALLRQLFDVDNTLFNLSELADLILSQPTLGSTVKVADEGNANEEDPWAFLTVINLHEHREKPVIRDLIQYIAQKSLSNPGLSSHLSQLLFAGSAAQIGLILTERFVNMPHEVVPPMYNMLLEEISWALEEDEPYNFTHYLILSKTYTEVSSKLSSAVITEDADPSQPRKKKKEKGGGSRTTPRIKGEAQASDADDVFYFHPEDEVLKRHALGYGNHQYTKVGDEGASDAKRAFQEMGIKPEGLLILIEAGKFESAVKAVEEYVGGPMASTGAVAVES